MTAWPGRRAIPVNDRRLISSSDAPHPQRSRHSLRSEARTLHNLLTHFQHRASAKGLTLRDTSERAHRRNTDVTPTQNRRASFREIHINQILDGIRGKLSKRSTERPVNRSFSSSERSQPTRRAPFPCTFRSYPVQSAASSRSRRPAAQNVSRLHAKTVTLLIPP